MDTTIVRAAIHPAIGVARVGNSSDEYFYGPEVPNQAPAKPGSYRDPVGALKRQAARFRLYGYNAAGEVVREITSDLHTRIRWTVDVANTKAAWYSFQTAMDVPQAIPCVLRNASLSGNSRDQLKICPGPRSIAGTPNLSGHAFDTGKFFGVPVYLGELRTDEAGRLVFLGGRGLSATPLPDNPVQSYANNSCWHDDVCDGPVSAEVTLDGKHIAVDPAWVVVAPPNFAPDIISIQTMYDLIFDACAGNWIPAPGKPSFAQNIEPLLRQFNNYQWVNAGFSAVFGWQGPFDFSQPDWLSRLSQAGSEYQPIRLQIFRNFIDPGQPSKSAPANFPLPTGFNPWPMVFGDVPSSASGHCFSLTATQYNYLKQWSLGQFVSDWNPSAKDPPSFDEVELAAQPSTLDKAALYYCMGGPFHPGGEMPWAMRQPAMYRAAFRIRTLAPGQPEPDFGDVLTPKAVQDHLQNFGDMFANRPGSLTRWMAVPWQTDAASCRDGHTIVFDPYLPTFWPARVPNEVLTEDDYRRVMDASLSAGIRRKAFHTRARWYRWLSGSSSQQLNQMIGDFSKFGVVERRDGPPDRAFPSDIYVESLPQFDTSPVPESHAEFLKYSPKFKW
jgi:hypothetical protein